MSTAANTTRFDDHTANRTYRPRLTFYHANGKGTGSAVQFDVAPACGDQSGAVFMQLARQQSVAGMNDEGQRRYASFDWQNKVIVKLNFNDLCQMLQVFRGQSKTIADGKGLYHDSRDKTTIINLTQQTEPFPGLVLDVSRKSKQDGDEPVRIRIIFNDAETYGLSTILEQSLSAVAFGIHKESRPFVAPAHSEPEQAAC